MILFSAIYTKPFSKTYNLLEKDVNEINSYFEDLYAKFSEKINQNNQEIESEKSLEELLRLEASFSESCKIAQSKNISLTNLVQEFKTKIYTKLADLELSLAKKNYKVWKEKQDFTFLEKAYNLILALQNHYYFSENAKSIRTKLRKLEYNIVKDKTNYHLNNAKQEVERAFTTLRRLYGPDNRITTAKSHFFQAFRNLVNKFDSWI